MTIWWCQGCGMEDTREHGSCPSCGSALRKSALRWLADGEAGDETIYELELTPLQRAAIVDALVGEGIRHRWEDPADLVVADPDEASADRILDEILGEELEEVDGSDPDGPVLSGAEVDAGEATGDDDVIEEVDLDGEDGYQVMSRLYLSAGNVLKSWDDDEVAAFIFTTGQALAAPAPYGMEDEDWADIQAAARNASAALEIDSEADVETQLEDLRRKLQELV